MKYQFILVIILFFVLRAGLLTAQDAAYKGGIGDGFTMDTVNVEFLNFTKGSNGDGYTSIAVYDTFYNYTMGGSGDGFSTIDIQNQFLDFSRGGNSDGFSYVYIEDNFNLMYTGGNSDGFSIISTQDDFNQMYKGGESDGFAYDKYGHIVLWTGNIGTGWNVAGNWENEIIPNYCNPVIIPSGVPNFPAVNSGQLRIGYYTDEGDYRCQRIKIDNGAEMTTRVNCFVENYDLIINRGKLFVKNPASDAFRNLNGGIINLKPNAELIFKE